jgi:hypothetical protein
MRRVYVLLCFCFIAMPKVALPQKIAPELPALVSYDVPEYPPLARQARIQGDVRVDVLTDGRSVVTAHGLTGHPLVSNSAVSNIKTWLFAAHEPTTAVITFHYRLDDSDSRLAFNPTRVAFNSATDVEVVARAPVVGGGMCASSRLGNWILTISPSASVVVDLFEECKGVLSGYGFTLSKKEFKLATGKVSETQVEFCIDSPFDGAPETLVLFKGRMDGDKMSGTFSDALGTQGSWTAVRQQAIQEAVAF